MRVVYRMRGLMGDATEDIIETLDSGSSESVDEEQLYHMADTMSQCGGLEAALTRCACMHVCACVCMHACVCACMCGGLEAALTRCAYVHACMCVCVHAYFVVLALWLVVPALVTAQTARQM